MIKFWRKKKLDENVFSYYFKKQEGKTWVGQVSYSIFQSPIIAGTIYYDLAIPIELENNDLNQFDLFLITKNELINYEFVWNKYLKFHGYTENNHKMIPIFSKT